MGRIRLNLYRKISKVIEILAAVIVFMVIVHGLNYLYVGTESNWYRMLWHNYYEDRGKIDNLYLGSSHVYNGINPQILDELSGQYNFNLATSGQLINGTYYLLKEAGQDNELSHVYLEMYYGCTVDDTKMDTAFHRNWNNTDYMELSFNKIQYMISNGGLDRCLDNFFPFVRYRAKLGDWEYVKQMIKEKREEDYLAYRYRSDCEEGMQQGFRNYTKVYSEREMCYEKKTVFEKHSMGKKCEQYCRKVIEYCQSEGIPITLFVSPICDLQLISTESYDNYINEIREIADEYEIPFYDFNLAKEQYLPLQANEHFGDLAHLNNFGSALFTTFFYEVVSREETENAEYFYSSYEDKLRESAPAVHGIYYREAQKYADTETGYKNIWVASNRDSGMEYRIILTPEEGEQYTVQDFEENKEFTVPSDEHGICTIVWRMGETPDQVQTMEIDY